MTKDDKRWYCSRHSLWPHPHHMSQTRSEVRQMMSPESLKGLITHIHLSYIIKQIYNTCNIFYWITIFFVS